MMGRELHLSALHTSRDPELTPPITPADPPTPCYLANMGEQACCAERRPAVYSLPCRCPNPQVTPGHTGYHVRPQRLGAPRPSPPGAPGRRPGSGSVSSLPCVSTEGGRDGGCAGAAGRARAPGPAGRGGRGGGLGPGSSQLQAVGEWAHIAQEPLQTRPEGASCVSWIRGRIHQGPGRLGRGASQPRMPPLKPTPWHKCLGTGSLQPPATPPRGWWSQAAGETQARLAGCTASSTREAASFCQLAPRRPRACCPPPCSRSEGPG